MALKNNLIYLDNAATTRPNPELLDLYNKVVNDYFANPSSIHFEGQKANDLLNKSRASILQSLRLTDHEVIFTSGATESINLAIKGYCLANQRRGKHIISSNIEHPAVKETINQLVELFGFEATFLKVNKEGKVSLEDLKQSIKDDTILVSIQAVNNEIGSINDIDSIAKYLKQFPKIVFHVDATQAIGKVNLNFADVDMISFSGHKIHALRSSGALIKKKNVILIPLQNGGGQEDGLRSGTNDLALAVTLAKQLKNEMLKIDEKKNQITAITELIYEYLTSKQELFHINSSIENPYIVNFSTINKKASVLVEALSNENIMVSSISACHSRREHFSDVVFAISGNERLAYNTVRISLDISNTKEEIETLIAAIDRIIGGIKQ